MYRDFIGMYQNVLEEGVCEHLIAEFEEVKANGLVANRQQSEGISKTKKQDEHFFLNLNQHQFRPYKDYMVNYWINKGLQECYDKYANEYDVLRDINIISTCIKMQKSTPGSGYHVWHAEQGNGESSARVLTWIMYLNDVDEAGETEFLYQKLRIPPKKNSLVIWPAAYTHAHRGNVVHGNTSKYILTGWFYAA